MIGVIIGAGVPLALVYLAGWGPLSAALTTPPVDPALVTPDPEPEPEPRRVVYRGPAGPLPRRYPRPCPGCGMQAARGFWEARARAATGMPSGHPERIVYLIPNPHEFADLETLLTDEHWLRRAAAAEQDARQTP